MLKKRNRDGEGKGGAKTEALKVKKAGRTNDSLWKSHLGGGEHKEVQSEKEEGVLLKGSGAKSKA